MRQCTWRCSRTRSPQPAGWVAARWYSATGTPGSGACDALEALDSSALVVHPPTLCAAPIRAFGRVWRDVIAGTAAVGGALATC